MDSKGQCKACGKHFSNASNLRRHAKQMHMDQVQDVAPLYRKNKCNFRFSCDICNRNFNDERNFKVHLKTHLAKSVASEGTISKPSKKCPLCSFSSSAAEEMLNHFERIHDINICCNEIDFSSLYEFHQWLQEVEKKTHSKFVKVFAKNFKKHTKTIYNCHRSGYYRTRGKGIRNLKIKGSVKINGYCPASIKLIQKNNGICHIRNIETHVGHSSKSDFNYLLLTKQERQQLASQIANKISIKDILGGIKDTSSNSELERIHLLNRHDLHNIKKRLKLTSESKNQLVINTWMNELKKDDSCVIFYKPEGTMLEDFPLIKNKDFILIIMTSVQCELLKKYGQNCICINGTNEQNNYNLSTLLILDNFGESFPCTICISNRIDEEVLKLFFCQVKLQAGIIFTKIFMSDITESYFNSWCDVMGIPEKRLFCKWNLENDWKNNLAKIKSKEKQITIFKHLQALLEELDFDMFHKMFNEFCEFSSNDLETKQFSEYFIYNYYTNYDCWAHSYIDQTALKTYKNLEQMHENINNIYLKNINNGFDNAVSAIMNFVRDPITNKFTDIDKEKFCSKINSRHKDIATINSNLIVTTENGWKVSSEENDFVFIQELNQKCPCQFICFECNICIHRYSCSCVDSCIKFNMCKHIHLLVNVRKQDISNNDWQNIDFGSQPIEIEVVTEQEIEDNGTPQLLDEEKEEMKKRICSYIDSVKSKTQLEDVKKILNPFIQDEKAACPK